MYDKESTYRRGATRLEERRNFPIAGWKNEKGEKAREATDGNARQRNGRREQGYEREDT